MRAKKLFPELTFKRLWNKITGVDKRVDELNSTLEWNLVKVCQATEVFRDTKDSYREYKLMAYETDGWWCEVTIPSTFLTDEFQYVMAGNTNDFTAYFYVSKNYIQLTRISKNGVDSTNCLMHVYAR